MTKKTGLCFMFFCFASALFQGNAHAASWGYRAGQEAMEQAFEDIDFDCSALDFARDVADDVCLTFPGSRFRSDCFEGVEKTFQELLWGEFCRPSSDECEGFGEFAATLIANGVCNVRRAYAPPRRRAGETACRDAALDSCRATVRGTLNDLVGSRSCFDEFDDLVLQRFEIYDGAYRAARGRCNRVVRDMFATD